MINTIIEYLNRTKGYKLDAEYYENIKIWREWWQGFHAPFHQFSENDGNRTVKRKLFTLKMAKKVCEDWASILLNEKTHIIVNDTASNVFLQGDDELGGVFGDNGFWTEGNALVEKAFSTGTGTFIVRLDGMRVIDDRVMADADTKIRIECISARHIIPITVRNGKIVDVSFVSESVEKGERYIYLETHALEADGYVITNEYFRYKDMNITPSELPPGLVPLMRTRSPIPLFAIISPNIVNTYDKSNGLGMSIYAHAIDNLMGVDLAFNNFCRDFKLGGKKVFYNRDMIKTDSEGNKITPDDVMQQLFVQVGDDMMDEQGRQKMVHEFNPSLRVVENSAGLQAQLDYLSFKCGLGTKHYQFNPGGAAPVTATQYAGDKQDLVQNASKHYIVIERALKELVRAILWAGREVLGQPVNPDAMVTVNFEDSYITDKDAERMRDLQEVRDGLMLPYEYRVKWRGEDEAKAKAMTAGYRSDNALLGFE